MSSGPKIGEARRRALGSAFETGADRYERIRPSYPAESIDWLLSSTTGAVAELGAGTGKLTEQVLRRGRAVVAMDTSANMLGQLATKLPQVPTHTLSAEDEAWPQRAADFARDAGKMLDLVLAAQAWHWFDPELASQRAAEAFTFAPAGSAGGPGPRQLGLVWNQLDVSIPWVHRFSRIIHAGDVHRPGFVPTLGAQFSAPQRQRVAWTQAMNDDELFELVRTRSYYLKASSAGRERVENNLRWYIYDHLGHKPGYELELPYVTEAFKADLKPHLSAAARPLGVLS